MLRKRIGSAIEEIDVLSAIPPTARNVLKLPSGVILRAITLEIIIRVSSQCSLQDTSFCEFAVRGHF